MVSTHLFFSIRKSELDPNRPRHPDIDLPRFLVDSGASTHILSDESKFITFDKYYSKQHEIKLADGSVASGVVAGRGNASVILHDINGNAHNVMLKNALCIPSFKVNIFSVQVAAKSGAIINFGQYDSELIAADGTRFRIRKHKDDNMYYLNNVNVNTCKIATHSLEEWHRIMGHCNMKDILRLESVVEGMKITDKNNYNCNVCQLGKMTQHISREADKRATHPLELVHTDLSGPIDPIAKDNFRYAITFVDDYSGAIVVYFLKFKSDAAKALEKYISDSAPYGKIKCIRSDNGTEFTSHEFESVLIKNQISHQFSSPYSPHQNGTAERSWRTLFEMGRCLLLEAELPKKLWAYAVRAAAYIRNRCFNQRTGKTPIELLTNNKPNLGNMHVFGLNCFAYVQEKSKLDDRCEEGIFLGYDCYSPAYLVYFPFKDQVRKVRCVKFNDKLVQYDEVSEYLYPKRDIHENDSELAITQKGLIQEKDSSEEMASTEVNNEIVPVHDMKDKEKRYPARQRHKPKHLDDYVTDDGDMDDINHIRVDYCYKICGVPKTYNEALNSPDFHKWQHAMNDEMQSLHDNNAYNLTYLPEGKSLIGGRWVYAIKIGPNNEEIHKCRYVAKGYSQVENIDYNETFSPTARVASIRMLMNITVQNDFVVHQMDAKTAYLHADIDCEIYVEQPKGYVQTDSKGVEYVLKLNKSLYGLKQSGRNWNNMLHDFLISKRFQQSLSDPCLYTKIDGCTSMIIVIWVDDILLAASSHYELNVIKADLLKNSK